MDVKSYKDLVVWQRAMDLTSLAYQVTAELPPDERFGLISQARRAAVSVAANIAEGHRRSSTKDYLRFLSFSAGSLAELETLIELSSRLYLIRSTNLEALVNRLMNSGRCSGRCNRGSRRNSLAPSP
jgi:four helix bundle protein